MTVLAANTQENLVDSGFGVLYFALFAPKRARLYGSARGRFGSLDYETLNCHHLLERQESDRGLSPLNLR